MSMWEIAVCLGCGLLLVFLLWKEIKRPVRQNLTWRIAASILAVISLAFLGIDITYATTERKHSAVLLTEGYIEDSVESFLQQSKNSKVYSTGSNWRAPRPVAMHIQSAGILADSLAMFDTVHLFGNGPEHHQLEDLSSINFSFHSTNKRSGITEIDWPRRTAAGKALRIQGRYRNHTSSVSGIYLSAGGIILDSVKVPAETISSFTLSHLPKQSGRFVYELTTLSGGDTISVEEVPVEILKRNEINLLVLSSAPDFETRFLRSWLAENGFGVAQRTRISSGKFDQQFSNISFRNLIAFNEALLKQFQVVIVDLAELNALSRSAQSSIFRAVESAGVGLILRTTSTLVNSPVLRDFSVYSSTSGQDLRMQVKMAGDENPFPPLQSEQVIYVRPSEKIQTIATGTTGIVAAVALYGRGKVALTTPANTFAWKLSGEETAYTRYWSSLVGSVIPEKPESLDLTSIPALPVVNDETELQFIAPEGIPQLQVFDNRLAVVQNATLADLWSSRWWPNQTGWNPVSVSGRDTDWVYVFKQGSWQSVRDFDKIKGAKETLQQSIKGDEKSVVATERKTLPKLYFFLLFLAGTAFLWIEKKRLTSS